MRVRWGSSQKGGREGDVVWLVGDNGTKKSLGDSVVSEIPFFAVDVWSLSFLGSRGRKKNEFISKV